MIQWVRGVLVRLIAAIFSLLVRLPDPDAGDRVDDAATNRHEAVDRDKVLGIERGNSDSSRIGLDGKEDVGPGSRLILLILAATEMQQFRQGRQLGKALPFGMRRCDDGILVQRDDAAKGL